MARPIRRALNLVFEAGVAAASFYIAGDTYAVAKTMNNVRPETNAMAAAFFIIGFIATLFFAKSLFKWRESQPEE